MPRTRLIVGLGNPGKKYAKTRHNAGFSVLDLYISQKALTPWKNWKDKAEVSFSSGFDRTIAAKPALFMNNSGTAVRSLSDFYGITPDEILVVSDDFSLELGVLRLRLKGSSGGHNGLESVIEHIGTSSFPRLRLGIGNVPAGMDPADFVLTDFSSRERETMLETYKMAVQVIDDVILNGVEAAAARGTGSSRNNK